MASEPVVAHGIVVIGVASGEVSCTLSKRLRQLERAGIIERRQRSVGKGSEYHLTPAGEELGPVLAQLGVWSERWLRRPIFEETFCAS